MRVLAARGLGLRSFGTLYHDSAQTRNAAISSWAELPFQSRLHEPFPADCRNASVKYFAPDCCAVAEMLGVPGAR